MSIGLRNSRTQYGCGGRLLHWTSVVLLLVAIATANQLADGSPVPERTNLVQTHASWGLVLMLVMSLRVYWRSNNPNPVCSYTIPPWQIFAATFLHRLIYVIVIGQCVIGVSNLCFAGNGVPLFHIFETPAMMSRNDTLSVLSNGVHYALYIAMYPLFATHISAAIYHQVFGVIDESEG